VKGPVKERWQILCEQAAQEQDSQKLLELTREINDLLRAKQDRLKAGPGSKNGEEPTA
jgi:hypothetical protein